MSYPATLLCDFYKVSHREQYPEKTELVYSTWTPRGSRMEGVKKVVNWGLQYFSQKYLIDYFNNHFFKRNEDEVAEEYSRVIKFCLGVENPDDSHIRSLHKLGYLPVKIKALEEGTLTPLRVPMFTIENTVDEFFWVTNYLETLMSCELWQGMTSATIANEYRRIADEYAALTCDNNAHVDFQCHDFSMRGMPALESAEKSGAGHLLSFTGTDTIPAILFFEEYYGANIEEEFVAGSIPASEHSVLCTYGPVKEIDTFKRFLTEIYPTGFFSIVSDTWDLWRVVSEYMPALKEEVLARNGRCVIRPDSGDPVKIICGDSESEDWRVKKGVIELLWDTFGGEINSLGYKVLDSHVGCIYGDSITPERAKEIFKQLEAKGFAASNIVLGVGLI